MLETIIHLDSNGQDLAIEHIRKWLSYSPETGEFVWTECLSNAAPAGSVAGSPSKRGYISIQINGRLYRAHRLAWAYVYGEWPDKDIDHINGKIADNRIANLRLATASQNQANVGLRTDNKSGLKGVSFHRVTGKWSATIQHQGRRIHLGLFTTPDAASSSYNEAALSLRGEFARAA
jgi:hypothetical protein